VSRKRIKRFCKTKLKKTERELEQAREGSKYSIAKNTRSSRKPRKNNDHQHVQKKMNHSHNAINNITRKKTQTTENEAARHAQSREEVEDMRAATSDRVHEAEDTRAATARVEGAGAASSTYPRSRQQQGSPHEKLTDEIRHRFSTNLQSCADRRRRANAVKTNSNQPFQYRRHLLVQDEKEETDMVFVKRSSRIH
jgi:hypothetical protein